MATEVTELVTRFSFAGNLSPMRLYNLKLVQAIGGLGVFSAAIGGSMVMLRRWTTRINESLDPLIRLSRNTKVAVATIQELEHVAEQTGGTSDALRGTIDALQQQIGSAARQGSEDFARLGISVRDAGGEIKTADQIIFELRDRFESLNLSLAEMQHLAGSIGVDRELIGMLQLSREEIERLRGEAREFGVLTEEQAEAINKYNENLAQMRRILGALAVSVTVAITPAMGGLTDSIQTLTLAHQDLIVNGIERLVSGLSILTGLLGRVGPLMLAGLVIFGLWRKGLLSITRLIALLLSPLSIKIALIMGAILIIDDLIVAFRGGNSAIREFIQAYTGIDIAPILQVAWSEFKSFLGNLREGFGDFIDFVSHVGGMIKAVLIGDFDGFLGHARGAFNSFNSFAENTVGALAEMFANIGKEIFTQLPDEWQDTLTDMQDGARQAVSNIIGYFTSGFQELFGWVGGAFGRIGALFGRGDSQEAVAGAPPALGRPGGEAGTAISQTDARTLNFAPDIDIHTADPDRAASVIRSDMQRQLRDAENRFMRRMF